MHEAVRVVSEKWGIVTRENEAGYRDATGSLNETKDSFCRDAKANASGVLERLEEIERCQNSFREYKAYVEKELEFQNKAIAWPQEACGDFLAETQEDKRVVAVMSLERIDRAHVESRKERRMTFMETFGGLAAEIDRARERDGDRILTVRNHAEVRDKRLGIDRKPGDPKVVELNPPPWRGRR